MVLVFLLLFYLHFFGCWLKAAFHVCSTPSTSKPDRSDEPKLFFLQCSAMLEALLWVFSDLMDMCER